MTARTRGFEFDEGDPSVGIFGGAWYHEACPAGADDPYPDDHVVGGIVADEQIACVRRDSMTVRVWFLITCSDCAQQTLVYDDDLSPSDEVVEEMERAEYEAAEQERAHSLAADRAEAEADAALAAFDDDPNPYHGAYSEC